MKRTKKIQKLVMLIPLPLIVCFVIFPYIRASLTSIKSANELYATSIKILPKETTFQDYVTLFANTDFLVSMFHSIAIAVITSCIPMLVSSMVSYAFARYRFRGENLTLSDTLLLYVFPSVLYLTPLSAVFNKLKLMGSPVVLAVSYCILTIPFSIWLLTSCIKNIPPRLGEAGKIDKANVPQLIYYVVVPLLKPGLIATGVYVFISSWNEYLSAIMFTTSSNRTLPVSLASLVGEYDLRWDIISVGTMAATIPVIILFMFIQKSLVAGLTTGSVKG